MSLSLTILGSSSATPTSSRHPSAYLLKSTLSKEFYLIDCGEGTQILLRRASIRMQQIGRIFISHLHGDHFFGLIGFIFTQNLLGRKEDLHIYAHKYLERIISVQLKIENTELSYPLIFHSISACRKSSMLLFEDESISITTFPLLHNIRTNGFLFREKQQERILRKDFIATFNPSNEEMDAIRKGHVYISPGGTFLPSDSISDPHPAPQSFAYCSDTAYTETLIPFITGVDLLFHEATFKQKALSMAKEKYHSTTMQAAEIAKLAKVKRLLIGHFSARYRNLTPLLDEAKSIFPNTIAALEGTVVKI
jgi:ribonuclease Z